MYTCKRINVSINCWDWCKINRRMRNFTRHMCSPNSTAFARRYLYHSMTDSSLANVISRGSPAATLLSFNSPSHEHSYDQIRLDNTLTRRRMYLKLRRTENFAEVSEKSFNYSYYRSLSLSIFQLYLLIFYVVHAASFAYFYLVWNIEHPPFLHNVIQNSFWQKNKRETKYL